MSNVSVESIARRMIAKGNAVGNEVLRLAQVQTESPETGAESEHFDPSSDAQRPHIAEFANAKPTAPTMNHTVVLQFKVPTHMTEFQESMLKFLNKFAETAPGVEFVGSQWKMEHDKGK